jgi:hypothetical protein
MGVGVAGGRGARCGRVGFADDADDGFAAFGEDDALGAQVVGIGSPLQVAEALKLSETRARPRVAAGGRRPRRHSYRCPRTAIGRLTIVRSPGVNVRSTTPVD